jgi:Pyruvate/2-oxoacid:ferredoxin oxidoreductase gamma subunit
MKILIAGEGGQGIQTAAQVLAKAAFQEGQKALYIPNFGVEQRGGASLAFLVFGEEAVYPKFDQADYLVLLSRRVQTRVAQYQGKKTKAISAANNLQALNQLLALTHLVKKETVRELLKKKLGKKFKDEEF